MEIIVFILSCILFLFGLRIMYALNRNRKNLSSNLIIDNSQINNTNANNSLIQDIFSTENAVKKTIEEKIQSGALVDMRLLNGNDNLLSYLLSAETSNKLYNNRNISLKIQSDLSAIEKDPLLEMHLKEVPINENVDNSFLKEAVDESELTRSIISLEKEKEKLTDVRESIRNLLRLSSEINYNIEMDLNNQFENIPTFQRRDSKVHSFCSVEEYSDKFLFAKNFPKKYKLG